MLPSKLCKTKVSLREMNCPRTFQFLPLRSRQGQEQVAHPRRDGSLEYVLTVDDGSHFRSALHRLGTRTLSSPLTSVLRSTLIRALTSGLVRALTSGLRSMLVRVLTRASV